MATFAELDVNHVVINLIKVRDEECGGGNFPESEPVGIEYLNQTFGPGRIWKQCSINGNFRKTRPEKGWNYDDQLDAFIPPKPYPSWVLNTNTYRWDPPTPYPNDGLIYIENGQWKRDKFYRWDEPTVSWVEAPLPPLPTVPPQA